MTDESDPLGIDAAEPAFDEAALGDPALETPAFQDDAPLDASPGLRLSAEESEALLDAIRSGTASAGARKAALGSADEPMRRALQRADEVMPSVATTLRDALVRASAGQSETTFDASGVVTYDTLTASLDRAAAVWRVHSGDPRNPLGLVVLGAGLATALLERRLGAPSTLVRVSERAPSPLERRVLEPSARELLNVAAAPFVPDVARLVLVEHRKEGETLSRFAPCLKMHMEVVLKSGTTSDVTIAFFGAAFATPTTSLGLQPARTMEAVSDVEVSAIAVLGRCQSTVRALLALESGSVLRLDGAPDRPIEIRVDGIAVLRGMPVVKDGNMAIEVRT